MKLLHLTLLAGYNGMRAAGIGIALVCATPVLLVLACAFMLANGVASLWSRR